MYVLQQISSVAAILTLKAVNVGAVLLYRAFAASLNPIHIVLASFNFILRFGP